MGGASDGQLSRQGLSNIQSQEISVNIIRNKLTALCAGLVSMLVSISVYAVESHVVLALEHAQTAAKSGDVDTIATRANAANSHIGVVDGHLKAGAASLEAAVAHGKHGYADLAKKFVEEAAVHLQAAQ